MKKIEVIQRDGFLETVCCKGVLRVVYRIDKKINRGEPHPSFFYCDKCFTACDGNSNVIGKYDKENDRLISE